MRPESCNMNPHRVSRTLDRSRRLASWLACARLLGSGIGRQRRRRPPTIRRAASVASPRCRARSGSTAPTPTNGSRCERNRPLTTRRPHRDRHDGARRSRARLDDAAPRAAAASSRSCASTTTASRLHLHDGSVAVRVRSREVAARVRARRPTRGASAPRRCRPLPLRPQRRHSERHRLAAASALRGRRQRAAADGRPARAEFWLDGAHGAPSTPGVEPARDEFADWTDARDRDDDRPVAALRVARDDRRRRPRPLRPLGAATRLRPALDADHRGRPAGRRTATATGPGCGPGAGPGSTMRRGASRRSTTAAGSTSADAGAGRRARMWRARCTRRRWWPGSAGRARVSITIGAGGRRSAGSRWRRTRSTCPSYRSSPRYCASRQHHARHQRPASITRDRPQQHRR